MTREQIETVAMADYDTRSNYFKRELFQTLVMSVPMELLESILASESDTPKEAI